MRRKELIVVLLLGLLVGLVATVRFFTTPLPTSPRRRVPGALRGTPYRPSGSPGALAELSTVRLWPPPNERLVPRDPGARSLFDAAEVVCGRGLFDAAIEAYQHFLKEYSADPACEMALLRIAQCCTLTRRHEEAARHYELLIGRYPTSDLLPMALLWSGDSHVQLGAAEMARKRLTEVVTRFPASPFAEGAKSLLARLDANPPAPTPKAPAPK